MTAIAYFEITPLPGMDPTGQPTRMPAVPGHQEEQWDALIAWIDPNLYVLAPHAADGTVCGVPPGGGS